MPSKKTAKETAALNRAQRKIVREQGITDDNPDGKLSPVDKFKKAFHSEHVPMYPHDQAVKLTKEEVALEKQLRAVQKLYLEIGHNAACEAITDLYEVSTATAERLIAQSKEYFGNIQVDNRELDKMLHIQRWEMVRNDILNNKHFENEDSRWKLIVEIDKQLSKLYGYDKPELITPKQMKELLQPPSITRTTDPKVLDSIGVEDAEIDENPPDGD